MAINTPQILEILRHHRIVPEEHLYGLNGPPNVGEEFPEIGAIEEGEAVYTTSIAEVFRKDSEERVDDISLFDDARIQDWWEDIMRIRNGEESGKAWRRNQIVEEESREPPEPFCAWYCPIHFFGYGWGIYIREKCILSQAQDIAAFVNWDKVNEPSFLIARDLLRCSFYVFFLHEQFHHKVESLGFRLLISTGADRYRPYKAKVYRAAYKTPDCLEESLANAESFLRLSEPRYGDRLLAPIRDGVRDFLRATMNMQPPGYAQGVHYLSKAKFRDGLYKLQSQALDALLIPTTPVSHWSVAPNMITALTDITDDIYVVLRQGARPIFPTSVDPGPTVSTNAIASALSRHYGYAHVQGGKGSHVKLKKAGAQTIVLPGNRPVLSPGVLKHVLEAFGGHPISRLPDLLEGRLRPNG